MTKDKKKLILIITILVIVIPIFYNTVMTMIGAKIAAKMRAAAPVVNVAPVEQHLIYDETESTGRLEAKYSVDVVARINGWLQKRYFTEGAIVKKGQTLFLIEPTEYSIAVQNAQAAVRQSQAALINSQKELARAQELVKGDFVSKSYYDASVATRDQNKARLDVNKATLAQAKLNLSYTRVVSPIDGKIGKILITEGNLVNTQAGTLANIVSTSPIFASFTLNSQDYLKMRKSDTNSDFSNLEVTIELADGSKYPIKGKVEFINNTVDPSAGTITLRASFPNPQNFLVPGDYVKVVVKSTVPRRVVLAPQDAVTDSTDGYFVWIIDKEGKAEQRLIKVSTQVEKSWVVDEGLDPGEVIITNGLQNLRPGIKVKVEEKIQGEDQSKGIKL